MKLTIRQYIPAAVMVLGLSMSSCGESFLDKEPTDYVSNEQLQEVAKWNPNIMMGQALGTYSTTFSIYSGGTKGHDDFGQKAVDIATDMMSGDMVNTDETYPWFIPAGRLTCANETDSRYTYQFWRYYYQIVKSANSIIDMVKNDESILNQPESKYYYAEAKALRAYAYFNLVNLYARPYLEDKTAKSVPIYETQNTMTSTKRSSVEEVYNFIEKDLTESIKAFDEAVAANNGEDMRASKDELNGDVARGLLAYTYLMKGDYPKAAAYSEEVINSGSYSLESKDEAVNGFSKIGDSWMWGIQLTTSNSPALPTFWGNMDIYTYSYAYAGNLKFMDTNLYAEIPGTDVRKAWQNDNNGQMKFYDSQKIIGNRNGGWYDAEVYMRVAEMYLINAEANARNNNLPAAKASLKALLDNRDTNAANNVNAMNKDQLLNEIWFNWRVEMWGEGRSLLTMKRFQKSVTRCPEDACLPGKMYDYKDSRLTFAIPQKETQNNPNLNK